MTKYEIRVAMATSRGWKPHDPIYKHGIWCWISPDGITDAVPDYYIDLNAMHEAALELNISHPLEYIHYAAEITKIVARDNSNNAMSLAISAHDATAAQRAEAYLRSKGLWKD